MANDPKEALDLPWWPKPAARTVQREPLSRDQIVAAAVQLIDAEGLEALSMRRLGQALEAGATSLYTHVRSKDELLALVNDLIAGEILREIKLDPSAPWREQAAECARAVRRILAKRHPHAAALFARSGAGPNALAVVEALLGVLRPAGFEGKVLLVAYGASSTTATATRPPRRLPSSLRPMPEGSRPVRWRRPWEPRFRPIASLTSWRRPRRWPT